MSSSALSEWMIVRSFMNLVQLRANPNESGFPKGYYLFHHIYKRNLYGNNYSNIARLLQSYLHCPYRV